MALQEDIRKRALERFSANEAVDFEELTDIATANGIKPVHPIMTGMFAKMRGYIKRITQFDKKQYTIYIR